MKLYSTIFLKLFLIQLVLVFYSCNEFNNNSSTDQKQNAVIDSLFAKSKDYLDNGNINQGKQVLKECLAYSEKNNIQIGKIKSYYLLCNTFYGQGIADSSAYYGEKAITLFNETESNEEIKKIIALVYTRLAIVYIETGNYGISYRYIFQSEKLVSNITDTEFLLEHNDRLAYVYYNLGLFKQSQVYYNKKLSVLKKHSSKYSEALYIQGIYRDIGLTYFNLKNYDLALAYYDSALAVLEPIEQLKSSERKKIETAIGVIRGNKGQAFAAQKKYKEAIHELEENIKINSKVGYDNIDATSSLLALANVYLQQNNIEKFKSTMTSSDSLYNSRATNVYFNRMIKMKALAFEKIDDGSKGYELLKKFIAWNDSATASFIKYNLRYKLGKIDIEKRNKLIEQLNNESKETQRRFFFTLTISILLIIVVILSIIGIYNFRKSDKKLRNLYKQLAHNQAALERSNLDMQKLVIEKNNILGIVAHDLKSPLSSIKGLTTLLESELNDNKYTNDDISKFLEYIKVSTNHMNNVTDDILEMSSLESSQTSLTFTETSINKLLSEIALIFDLKLKEKFITLEIVATPSLKFKINEKKIERAIGNLVNNAIKFSNAGSSIKINAEIINNNLQISISDQGIGIDAANIHSIFDRFTKSKNIGTAGEKPVGLGLSIVKQIIEKHNGTISVQSEKNVGTTFIITIPPNI